ncbi:MAG TPA: glycosyltransferase, partial [Nitrospira sp.]|nr:glycosyltransferase [Nitrospira sp.]
DHGHRSIVISAGGRMVEQLRREGSEHLAWDVGRKSPMTLLRYVGRLRRFLADERVDILHLRSRMPAWVGYLAWRGMSDRFRPHLVTTVHGPYSVNRYGSVMARGERVIAISNMIVDYLHRHYPDVPDERIRLIYRGVDPARFPHGYQPGPDWLESWGREYPGLAGKCLITLPARITRWKGQEDFLRLVARVRERVPDIHGLLVGETKGGKSRFLEELKSLAVRLGIDDAVSFLGHRSDLREIMAISRVVVSLSREPEAFGRVSLEALSLGVPVVGYAHGGVGEQLERIFPLGSVPMGAWEEAVERVCICIEQSQTVPTEQPFTLSRMLDATLSVYMELARPGASGHVSS